MSTSKIDFLSRGIVSRLLRRRIKVVSELSPLSGRIKMALEYDQELEKTVCKWMESITGVSLTKKYPLNIDGLYEALKNGEYLAKLMNTIKEGSVTRVNESVMLFKREENIESFLKACKEYGVDEAKLFMVKDLSESRNMPQVLRTLNTLKLRYEGQIS